MAEPSAGLVDIVAPAAPAVADWSTAIVATAIVVLMTAVMVYRIRSRRLRARRHLSRLQRKVRAGGIDPRQAVYTVAAELRQGLDLPRLDADTEPTARVGARTSPKQRWRQFNANLARYRYAPAPPGSGQALDAIREAKYWLRPWH